jgi:hypothetical protein
VYKSNRRKNNGIRISHKYKRDLYVPRSNTDDSQAKNYSCQLKQSNKRNKKKSITIIRFPVTGAETISMIRSLKLKNSTGYNKVSSWILRHYAFEISKPFSYTCNSSLQYGIYPERLKYPVVSSYIKMSVKTK